MKNFLCTCLFLAISSIECYANTPDEVLLQAAKSSGITVYHACIETPPVTAEQVAVCTNLYGNYVTALTTVNMPEKLIPSIDPDPYAWSPYDICRYETGHIVFGDQLSLPYCPTV